MSLIVRVPHTELVFACGNGQFKICYAKASNPENDYMKLFCNIKYLQFVDNILKSYQHR